MGELLSKSEKQALRKKNRLLYDTSAWPMFGQASKGGLPWFWIGFTVLMLGCFAFGVYVTMA